MLLLFDFTLTSIRKHKLLETLKNAKTLAKGRKPGTFFNLSRVHRKFKS